eukprot:TRINITY_DN25016_c0_g1_i1.p1 TRINITY_DN25016_c0_g1~~TRINITY_DN25016_c0_g1_i1.p1  ORF type:complete len:227 (+),score=16.94 TRINITY_DN25016_c0_g1_i1:253-933(+)
MRFITKSHGNLATATKICCAALGKKDIVNLNAFDTIATTAFRMKVMKMATMSSAHATPNVATGASLGSLPSSTLTWRPKSPPWSWPSWTSWVKSCVIFFFISSLTAWVTVFGSTPGEMVTKQLSSMVVSFVSDSVTRRFEASKDPKATAGKSGWTSLVSLGLVSYPVSATCDGQSATCGVEGPRLINANDKAMAMATGTTRCDLEFRIRLDYKCGFVRTMLGHNTA